MIQGKSDVTFCSVIACPTLVMGNPWYQIKKICTNVIVCFNDISCCAGGHSTVICVSRIEWWSIWAVFLIATYFGIPCPDAHDFIASYDMLESLEEHILTYWFLLTSVTSNKTHINYILYINHTESYCIYTHIYCANC